MDKFVEAYGEEVLDAEEGCKRFCSVMMFGR